MNKDYWYVGQQVSDQRYGNGEIIDIFDKGFKGLYPIVVRFINNVIRAYSICGKYDIEDLYSVLSPNPHVSIKYNKVFKKGDVVKYKRENAWYLGIYEGIEEGLHKINEGFSDENMTKIDSYYYIEDEDILKY